MALPVENLFTHGMTTCSVCGMEYGVPSSWLTSRRADGATFWCPNGHQQCFRETAVAKLEKGLANLKQRLEWAEKNATDARAREATARKAEAISRGKLRAQSERVKNGVCPCCHRTFRQLAAHMLTKHPDWKGEGGDT